MGGVKYCQGEEEEKEILPNWSSNIARGKNGPIDQTQGPRRVFLGGGAEFKFEIAIEYKLHE